MLTLSGAVIGGILFITLRWNFWERLSAAITAITITVMSLSIVFTILASPLARWNNIRLMPTFALLAGHPIYSTPNEGPIYSWLYGPLAAVMYLPATLAHSPVSAITIAATEAVIFFLLPLLGIFFVCSKDYRRGRQMVMALLGLISFFALISGHEGLVYAMFKVHADAPAIGFASLSALFLHFRQRNWDVYCSLAALFAVFSLLTKQTMLPLIIALPLYVLITEGPQRFLRFSLIISALLAVSVTTLLMIFGIEPVIFTMFDYPKSMGWHTHLLSSAKLNNDLMFAIPFLKFSDDLRGGFLLILLLPIFVIGWRASLSKEYSGLKNTFNSMSGLLLFFAIFLLPMSLLARAKIGGAMNSYAPTTYFLIAACIAGTLEIIHINRSVEKRARRLGIILLTICAVSIVPTAVPSIIRQVNANPLRLAWGSAVHQAYDYLLQYPGATYFPWYPLSALLAEGELHHTGVGLVDRDLAGVPTNEEHLKNYLPKNLTFIAMKSKGRREKAMLNLHFSHFNIAGDASEVGACKSTQNSCLDSSWKFYSVFPAQLYINYVDKYPDLITAYNQDPNEMLKHTWGLQHYCEFGLREGRSSPGVEVIHCSK